MHGDKEDAMKIIVAEGEPEEIARLDELTEIFAGVRLNGANRGSAKLEAGQQDAAAANGQQRIPTDILAYIKERAGTSAQRAHFVEMFVQRVMDLGGVEVEIGTSSRTKDGLNHYLMLRDSGPRHYGAVVYVKPATAGTTFRLPVSSAEGRRFAKVRKLSNRERSYQISLGLRSEEAVEEAVELAKEALGLVRG
jgi:hypothetical protein